MSRSTSRELRAIIIDLIKYNAQFTFGMFVVLMQPLGLSWKQIGWRQFYFSHGNQGLEINHFPAHVSYGLWGRAN